MSVRGGRPASAILRAARLGAALALGGAILAAPASAEVRRVEVVGAVPAGPHASGDVPVRRTALEKALGEAVRRVARELLEEQGGARSAAGSLGEALGGDPVEYSVRYRVIEDRGERRSLLVQDPEVSREYVVVAEVFVDVDRVAERLRRAGLLSGARGPPVRMVRVEAEGVRSWAAYAALREALVEAGGAESAVPATFEAGRVVLRVRVAADAFTLWDRLARDGPEGARLELLERAEGRLRLQVIDTSRPNRY